MSISSRIHDTIENWVVEWRDRLRGWMMSWIEGGAERLMDAMEPELRTEIKPSLLRLREIPGLPDDFVALIDKTLAEPGFIHLAAILPYLVGMLFGMGMGAAAPIASIGAYQIDNLVHSYRIDPMSVITAWRRDPEAYAHLFDDLKDQGWSDDKIEALKFLTLFIPTADEQTLWLAREVFEPLMVDRYGLDDELPSYEETDFSKVGVDPEQMRNKWRAHWEHASFMQVIEMLHRGLLTLDRTMLPPPTTKEGWAARDAEGEKALFDWYRLVEIPPFWRPRLTAMSWNVPTRVDLRRWWDMRVIDEQELYNVYHRQGYHGKDLDNYVLWTKVYVAFPDLIARWTKGWISIDDVRSQLTALGMPAERLEEFIQMKVKAEQPARVEKERDLTKADIIKWVKADLARWEQGIELLMDMGYDRWEADTILDINISVEGGSPETFEEFKRLTHKLRVASGMEEKPMSEELKAAADEVVKLTGEVEALERSVVQEKRKLIKDEVVPEAATKKLTALEGKLHRAQSELARVKTEYNMQLAEWRHG